MATNWQYNQIQDVLNNYKNLKYIEDDCYFIGELTVDDSDNDIYKVKIDPGPFPILFPIVWEIGQRIPPTVDRHIYSANNSLCFTTSAKQQILLKTKIKSLLQFLDEILIKFLQNNSYFELNGKYLNGEYHHGAIGILGAYSDILYTNNYALILEMLYLRKAKKKFGRNEECFCGSNKIKKCHLKMYKDLFYVDDSIIENDFNKIIEMLKIVDA